MTATNFPPLRSTDSHPVHGAPVPEGCFYACEYPERPFDENRTWYDWRCRACVRHAEAVVAHGHDPIARWSSTPGGLVTNDVALSWLVSRSLELLGMDRRAGEQPNR